MSYESENFLPKETSVKDVLDLISSLGYIKDPKPEIKVSGHVASFYWYEANDYKSWTGVYCSVRIKEKEIIVYTRTNLSRSYWDLVFQNKTIRELRKRFGGTFSTDEGTNRFLHPIGKPPIPEQSGCYLASERFHGNIGRAHIYLMNRTFPNKQWEKVGVLSFLDAMNPRLLSNNLLSPLLVAVTEDYFKSVFVCLLKYSDKKENFMKSGKISSDHLLRISNGELTVEEAVAETMSFQNIYAICKHFKTLNQALDLESELKKPYRKRKETLLSSLEKIVTRRHGFIHHGQMDIKFTDKDVLKAIDDIEESVKRFDRLLTKKYNWQPMAGYNY